ncbi:MAG: efflux RND transporter periplasmic adaptor subunit [Candidatus Zixiibacteriota bacterium]
MTDEKPKPDIASLRIDSGKRQSDRPHSRKWWIIVWVVVVAIVVVGYFWFKESITPAMKVRAATVTALASADAHASLVATGYVVAQVKAEVASKGTGRLEYLGFEEGDAVDSNQVIAILDNDDIKADLDLARANLLKAEADSLNGGRTFRRATELLDSGSITLSEWESAETLYKQALAGVAAAEAQVKAAEVALDNTYIRAPFHGTILTKNADVGEIVAPFASSASSKGSVVTMADMSSLEVEADVSESNIHKVKVGQKCEIILDAYPNTRYPGYVKKIVPTADRARATVLTKVAFSQKDDRVLPEMSARVNFLFDTTAVGTLQQQGVVVAKDAITIRDGRKVVFRIDGQEVTEVTVRIGRELGSVTEILDGLEAGDRVVASPPGKMESGQKVEISN